MNDADGGTCPAIRPGTPTGRTGSDPAVPYDSSELLRGVLCLLDIFRLATGTDRLLPDAFEFLPTFPAPVTPGLYPVRWDIDVHRTSDRTHLVSPHIGMSGLT